ALLALPGAPLARTCRGLPPSGPLLLGFGCLPRFLAVPEALQVPLLGSLDGEGPRRNVPGDDGPGSRHGPVPHLDRGHEHGVRADPDVVSDHGPVLVPSIVVNGDGPGTDVRVLADDRIV